MKLQVLTPTIHGVLDYLAAAGLIALPFVLGLRGVGLWLSVAGGGVLALYSLFTDYRFSALKWLPYDAHLLLDLGAAAAFLAAPSLLGFDAFTSAYYYVMAGGVVLVVAFSRRVASNASLAS